MNLFSYLLKILHMECIHPFVQKDHELVFCFFNNNFYNVDEYYHNPSLGLATKARVCKGA